MKTCRVLIVAILMLFSLIRNNAHGFEYVMGDKLYPYSTQAQPAKGESYVDSTYHTTITRVTDSRADHGNWGTICGYSTWDPLSSDGQYLIFKKMVNLDMDDGYGIYNAQTLQYYKGPEPLGWWWNSQDPEPRWDTSGSHPTWIYYRKDKQLRYIDIADDSDHLVHDFSGDFPQFGSSYYINNGEEGVPSADSRYWVFCITNENSPYQTKMVFTYDKTLDQVIASKDITGHDPNSVSMSQSGNYVYLAYEWTGKNNEFDGPHVYHRDFTNPVKICSGIPHLTMLYDAQGNEVAFYMDQDYVSFTRLDNGQQFDLYYQEDMGWDGSNLLHTPVGFSKRGWGLISVYSEINNHWSDNQIFMFELDETKTYGSATRPRIWRISFAQNIIGNNYYGAQPNAQLDHAGTRVWWGADWRNTKGAMEVYQCDLPATWWEDLSGSPKVQIVTSSLPSGAVGSAYSQTLQASGGTRPYTWSLLSGSLPVGSALYTDPGTDMGVISSEGEKLAVEGTFNFAVQVSDSSSPPTTATRNFTITVSSQDTTPPTISNVLESPSPDSATITWETDEPATSRVDYGEASYTSYKENLALTRSHSISLTALQLRTSYNYKITSADSSGNAATHTGQFMTADDLVLFMRFDEGAGSTASDSSPCHNDGTIVGAVWASGKSGSALSFNGAGDYVRANSTTNMNLKDYITIEAWVYSNSYANEYHHIVNKGTLDGVARGYGLNVLNGVYNFVKAGVADVGSGVTAPTGRWEHIAVTWDSGTNEVKFYVDGVSRATVVDASDVSQPADSDYLTIGAWMTGESGFSGMIDEVRVYSRVLSADEILAHYNQGETDTSPPAAVSDLAASAGTSDGEVGLTWTAPGDDGNTGIAATYDMRYSATEITESNWGSATQVLGEPTPQAADSSETLTVTGLSPNTLYYFAMKTSDEVPNESGLSNVASATTSITADTDPPTISDCTGDTSGTTGERVTIRATLTDNVGVTVARLYYKGASASSWSSRNFISGSASFRLPSDSTEDVYYYVTANDAAGNGPVGVPSVDGSVCYTVTVIDNDPPTISGCTGNTIGAAGSSVIITVTLTDNIGVAEARLYYRAAAGWSSMNFLSGFVSIPISKTSPVDIYYYITADDGAGNGPVGDPSVDGSLCYIVSVKVLPDLVVHMNDAGDGIVLLWESVPGQTYQILYCDSLLEGWYNLGPELEGTGSLLSVEEDAPIDDIRQRFYRLMVW